MVSYSEQRRQKWAYETSIWFSSCCLYQKSPTPRTRQTNWRAYPSRTTVDGIPLQAHRGGTSLNGIGNELKRFFCDLFGYSWFRSQSIAIHCNRRGVHNSHHAYHTAWLKTSHRTCQNALVIPSSCHPWWVFDRPFVVRLFVFVLLLFLSVVYFFFPYPTCTLTCTLSSISTAPKETPAAPRPMRSIAPWRYTILSQLVVGCSTFLMIAFFHFFHFFTFSIFFISFFFFFFVCFLFFFFLPIFCFFKFFHFSFFSSSFSSSFSFSSRPSRRRNPQKNRPEVPIVKRTIFFSENSIWGPRWTGC